MTDCPSCPASVQMLPVPSSPGASVQPLPPAPDLSVAERRPGSARHVARPVSTPARPLPAPAFMEHFPRAQLCSEEHPRVEWQRRDLNPGMLAQGQTISAPSLSPSGIRGQAQAGTVCGCPPASPSVRWAFHAQLLSHTALLLPAHCPPPPHAPCPGCPVSRCSGPEQGSRVTSLAHAFYVQFLSKLRLFSSRNRSGVGRFPGLDIILQLCDHWVKLDEGHMGPSCTLFFSYF